MYQSLGAHYDVTVAGIRIPVDVPLEKVAADAAAAAVPAATAQMPKLMAEVNKQLPALLDEVRKNVRTEMWAVGGIFLGGTAAGIITTIMAARCVKNR